MTVTRHKARGAAREPDGGSRDAQTVAQLCILAPVERIVLLLFIKIDNTRLASESGRPREGRLHDQSTCCELEFLRSAPPAIQSTENG
jgi:hypothetical protein